MSVGVHPRLDPPQLFEVGRGKGPDGVRSGGKVFPDLGDGSTSFPREGEFGVYVSST